MLTEKDTQQITSRSVYDWMIAEEPTLVKRIHDHFYGTNLPLSFDTAENTERLKKVSDYIEANSSRFYSELTPAEKLLLYIMKNGFGWIVYENMDATLKIIATIFRMDFASVQAAAESLSKKFLLFKYERLKQYSFLFVPPVFLRNIDIPREEVLGVPDDTKTLPNDRLGNHTIPLIAGLISYIVTYSPRSSENNEIHKIDMTKMLEFFGDSADRSELEGVIKKLSRFGFFQKFNNRIIINKAMFDAIVKLSLNEQLFIIFLYDFMHRFDFRKSAFMTLKILAMRSHQKKSTSLRELFFHYLNNETYITLKNENKSLRLLLQQEELKFIFFVRNLESEGIARIIKKDPERVSIGTDSILMNEPHTSLLNDVDFSPRFVQDKFVIEPNFEVIVEPFTQPSILFRLALISEPATIQTISIFRINRQSIYRSFAYGVKKDEILPFLREYSKHEIPKNVEEGIQDFVATLSAENFEKYFIIQVSAQSSGVISDRFKNQLIEVEPHTFLVFDEPLLKTIEEFCKNEKITYKRVRDFLGDSYYSSLSNNPLEQNIKHLHKLKDFFDFYGNEPTGANRLRIDTGA